MFCVHYVMFIGITCFYNIIGLGNQHEEFLLSGLAVALLLLPSLHHLPVVLGGPREVAVDVTKWFLRSSAARFNFYPGCCRDTLTNLQTKVVGVSRKRRV